MFDKQELDILGEEAVKSAITKVISDELDGHVDLSRATVKQIDTAIYCLRYYRALMGDSAGGK